MTDTIAALRQAIASHYRIERELGAGGMATVYLAHDLRHDRDVAIKVLHPDLGAALGGERFLSEIKTTAKLQHPHVLPLLDSGDAGNGLLYYVMPLVTGESLRDRLARERQLPIDEALKIAREVADALGHAHALGIIHRDIKPENILLQGGHALVADFGIALAVQSAGGARMTQTGLSLGTPQYMSPEQAMGEKVIDARSDIYALGAVTYEMLTGEPPFTGASVQAIVARILTEEPRSLIAQRKAVPESVDAAVLRALEKLPADRFTDAAAFVTALDADVPASRRASTSGRGTASSSLRLVGAAVTLVAVSLAAGWMIGRRGMAAAPAPAWSTSILLPDSLQLEPLRGNSEGMATMALSPDGTQLAFVARRGEHTQLFIRRMSDFSARAIDGTEGAMAPFFSPSSDVVAFFAGSLLKRVSLVDGRVSDIASNINDPWGGTWAADGRVVVARERASQLLVLSPSGDSLRGLSCNVGCSFPDMLPDGRRVVVTGWGGLRTIDIETDSEVPLLRAGATNGQERVRGMMARYDGDGHLVYVGLGGQVLSAPFDAKRATFTGAAVTLAEGVRVETGRGAAQFALSRAGVLAYVPGPVMSVGILVRADRSGKLDTIPAPPANYNALELSPDGRQLAVRVGTVTGDVALQIIDVMSGKVTPWLTGPSLGRPRWAADGRRLVFEREGEAFIGDPNLSAPPTSLRLPARLSDVSPMGDSATFRGWANDTLNVLHTDGRPPQQVFMRSAGGVTSSDDRWYMSEEAQGSTSAVVARALDGSGRRIVIAGEGRYAMVGWAAGGHEFIVADAQRMRERGNEGTVRQGFGAISYNPSNSNEPFGEPRLLFSAITADFPGRNYASGMGGNRFVFKQHAVTQPPREVRVIGDWHQRLQAGARP